MTHDDRILEILKSLSTNVATILEEQQSQRTDIRSLQRDVSEIKLRMATKADVEAAKKELNEKMATSEDLAGSEARVKVDIQDLHKEIGRALKTHEERLKAIEKRLGIIDPTKH